MVDDEPAPFHRRPGVEDWRILGDGLQARYRCPGLPAAARFATEVAARLDGRSADLDLRATTVTIRLHPRRHTAYDDVDVETARLVQTVAREHGMEPEPGTLRSIQLAVAHASGVEVQRFWEAVLGYERIDDEDSEDPQGRGPRLWFHEIAHGRTARGRTHVDVYLPAEESERVIADALAAGGRIADDSHAPDWWTLASPDNHGVDVAPWPDRQ